VDPKTVYDNLIHVLAELPKIGKHVAEYLQRFGE
jgi:hypothetical protein